MPDYNKNMIFWQEHCIGRGYRIIDSGAKKWTQGIRRWLIFRLRPSARFNATPLGNLQITTMSDRSDFEMIFGAHYKEEKQAMKKLQEDISGYIKG